MNNTKHLGPLSIVAAIAFITAIVFLVIAFDTEQSSLIGIIFAGLGGLLLGIYHSIFCRIIEKNISDISDETAQKYIQGWSDYHVRSTHYNLDRRMNDKFNMIDKLVKHFDLEYFDEIKLPERKVGYRKIKKNNK